MITFLKRLFRGKKSDPIVVGYQPLPSAKRMEPPRSARSTAAPRAFSAPYGGSAARPSASSSGTPRRTDSSSDDLSNPLNPMSPLSPLSPMNQLSASSAVAEPSHRSTSHCSPHSSHDTSSSTTHSSHDHSPSHSSHDYSCSSSSNYDSGSSSSSSDW
jgi:hypothetical protein